MTPPSIDLVLVDFDDTLVETAPRFLNSRSALFELLHRSGFDPERARRVHHDEVEPEMLRTVGFGPYRLEPSFRETYARLCAEAGLPVDPAIADSCADLGRAVAGTPPPIAGALQALASLAEVHPTAVYTQAADAEYQLSCLTEAGVLAAVGVERVVITPRKTAAAFREAIAKLGATDPSRVWMVGNSIRSDVNPALEAGANAILVEIEGGWEYDHAEPVSDQFLRAGSFVDAARILLDLDTR